MSRKTARKHAFNLVFQLPFHEGLELGQAYENLKGDFSNLSDDDKEFIYNEFKGTAENLNIIDSYITKNLKKWTIDRIEKELLAIIRLATYEIIFDETIPTVVSINEAIELSKVYSDEKGRKFVNAILGNIVKDLNEKE